jgi:hypothetical protein
LYIDPIRRSLLSSYNPDCSIVMAQLYNVEVYSAQEITIEWVVEPDASRPRVVGRADSGRVKLTVEGSDCLRIFIKETAVNLPCPPIELHEELAKFCNIVDPNHRTLLHWLLAENNIQEIEDIFQRRGIPNDLPTFDMISKSPPRSDIPIVLDTHMSSHLPSDVGNEANNQRTFHGRRNAQKEGSKYALQDGVQDLVDKFNLVNSFQKTMTGPWQASEAENLLSHVCRLENMDPFSLLPQRSDAWSRQIRQAGGYPDQAVGIVFDEKSTSHDYEQHSRSAQIFPAVVEITARGVLRVRVSTAVQNTTDEEVLLAGELYVRDKLSGQLLTANHQ